jgi:hypothetical protein
MDEIFEDIQKIIKIVKDKDKEIRDLKVENIKLKIQLIDLQLKISHTNLLLNKK